MLCQWARKMALRFYPRRARVSTTHARWIAMASLRKSGGGMQTTLLRLQHSVQIITRITKISYNNDNNKLTYLASVPVPLMFGALGAFLSWRDDGNYSRVAVAVSNPHL